MKLSQQERKVVQFLSQKQEVFWEELVQFCKNPASVKLKTVKKVVSDIKKKFKDNNLPVPFTCSFKELAKVPAAPKMTATKETVDFHGQKLVQVKRNNTKTSQEQIDKSQSVVKTTLTALEHTVKPVIPDFSISLNSRHIRTRSGNYNLNYDEFDIFQYLYNNRGKFISLEELRDQVCFPKFGSKLPARWFSAIQRRISNIRHQIPETRDKLLTAKQQHVTGYIFN